MNLDDLNIEQRNAVTQMKGPIMIVAGAGSGKTRTLTYRIAHLLQQGVSPYNIIALTFTNKAAKEMKDRIIDLVGVQANALLAGTFHSIFSRILRQEGYKIGYDKNYTIYDDDDSKKLIADIVKGLNLDDKNYRKGKVLSRISQAKCALFSPMDYENRPDFIAEDEKSNMGMLYKVYQIYQNRLRQSMAMDFDDILFNMNILLRDCKDVKEKLQRRFEYILVDEYQDTNYSQYLIVKKLAEYHRNICVVGDDAQSIYSFRGANISNILNFNKDYPDATTYKLEQNYRSTKNIINAANSIIAHNENQIPKTIWTANDDGSLLSYKALSSDREEADWVGRKIATDIEAGEVGKEIAILYRTNSQSRAFEDSLRLKNIPYIIYSGTSFYSRKEIKDVLAYLRLVVNHRDDEAFLRIINYPARGIGATTMDRLKIASQTMGSSLFETAERLTFDNAFNISKRAVQTLIDFCTMINSFTIRIDSVDAYTLGKEIVQRSGIKTELSLMKDTEDKDRLENVEELLVGMQSFVENEEENIVDSLTGEEISIKDKTLDVFLQQISLMTSTDVDENDSEGKVKLMTIHAAKGLEFNNVYVVGMEENLFPSAMSFATRDDIEEERRLFYVAVTRARKHLYLSSAKMRFRNGELSFTETSRFVGEIDKKYLLSEDTRETSPLRVKEKINFSYTPREKERTTITLKKKQPLTTLHHNVLTEKKTTTTINLKPKGVVEEGDWRLADFAEVEPGVKVRHSKFGCGVVVSTEVVDRDKRAVVDFFQFGNKTLILKFAKLEIKEN
ncbi:MAG: UvrD-helicase domain-containing protein [Bacteroidales bacterium]|nr:UvrD-helicase domain-containing protein [Bacteroidales bacterium]